MVAQGHDKRMLIDVQLIIVEDPSAFGGRGMIFHLPDDPRIRYVKNETRTGFVAQKNLAISLSRAPYVAMMDADDISEPARLEQRYTFSEANPDIKVFGVSLSLSMKTAALLATGNTQRRPGLSVRQCGVLTPFPIPLYLPIRKF